MFQARVRSSRRGALLPLPGTSLPHTESSSVVLESHSLPVPLACLDLASSSASMRLLRGMFGPSSRALPYFSGHPENPYTALALPGSVGPFPGTKLSDVDVLDFGLSVGIGLEERLGLGLDCKISRTFAEVEERVNRRMGRLKVELQRREMELERERRDGERLRSEKKEVEERAAYLSRQVRGADMLPCTCVVHTCSDVDALTVFYFYPSGLSCHGDDGAVKKRSARKRQRAE